MVIGIFGESCTGKSTLADILGQKLDAKVYTGKEYMKLEKNEGEAKKAFQAMLSSAQEGGENVIYVIAEKEHLTLLPEKAVRVLATAELDTIKERFAERMNGILPPPVAAMLEKKHGMFDSEPHDLRVESGGEDLEAACGRIIELCQA